jgi:succinate-acetate transporter protein
MRERLQKPLLIVAGLLFVGGIIPLVMFYAQQPAVAMLMSIYVTLGVFLLLAASDPAAHRSLIAFAGWANIAHAAVMSFQAYRHAIQSRELLGVAVFAVLGVALLAITPPKQTTSVSVARAA